DTVALDTPARRDTSLIVDISLPCQTQLASVISITATAHIISRTEYIRFRFPWKPIFRFHSI
ncbi:hypothetical protein, partial [Escherichia coli]|uniref:hypothetical protein n=1 Tax=Escherichia coli TaxID=562 RepID=UPI00289A9703